MPAEVENIILNAQVVDNFSKQLDELKRELGEIEALGEATDVDVDAHIGGAMAELHAVEAKIRQVDKMDANPDVHADGGLVDPRTMWNLFDLHNDPGPHWGKKNPFREGLLSNLDTPEVDVDDWSRIFFGRGGVQSIDDAMGQGISPFNRPRRGTAPTVMDALGEFKDLNISMGDLMNVFAGLVPLLLLFVGTLPAAISGLVALAGAAIAAAGALVGVVGLALGGLAFEDGEFAPDELMEQVSDLVDVFVESFGPLMNALEPLANEIFRDTEFFIRDLASRMSILLDMTDMAGGAIGWLAETLPVVLQEMMLFGQAAAPVMEFIIGGMSEIDWFGIMADVITDIIGPMSLFFGILMRMMPVIYEMSVRFMGMANAILGLVGLIYTVIDFFPFVSEIFASLAAIILIAASATFLLTTRMAYLIAEVMTKMVQVVAALITRIYAVTAAQLNWAAAVMATAAAVATLLGLLTLGVGPLVSTIIGGVGGMGGGEVNEINKRLNNFETQGTGQSGTWSQDRNTGYTEINSTIVAPDKDTGLAASNSNSFIQGSRTTNPTDVENEQHSG